MRAGDRPGALLESETIYCLNDPSVIGDVSWIKPGKITFPWWNGDVYDGRPGQPILSFEMAGKYIDFCARRGLPTHALTSTKNPAEPGPHLQHLKRDSLLRQPLRFTDKYSARSDIMPCSGYGGTNAETKRAYDECRQVTPFMLGDWIAWQFDRPELGGGVVQAFRRERNEAPTQVFRLRAPAPSAQYEVTDLDAGVPKQMTGKELMEDGLAVEITTKPGAAVIFHRKTK